MTLPAGPRPPHPYARRHLAAHAAAGGRLDDVLTLETLPYLDEARLSTLLRLTEPTPLSPQWLLLSAWRSIRHRWSWDDPDGNAAALDVAHMAVDPVTPLPDRWTESGLTWKPRIAEWQSGGTIVAGEERGGLRLAIGTVRGAPILVTGSESWVRLWDPATGQPIGEPLSAPGSLRALALAEGPGLVLTAYQGGVVIAWDAVTHLQSATLHVSEPAPTTLAAAEAWGRWVVATGGASGVVQVRWIDGGELVNEYRGESVRAVALGKAPSGLLHLAIGYSDGRIAVFDAISGELSGPGIIAPGGVTDVALAPVEGMLVIGAATDKGFAGVWDAPSGTPVSALVKHEGELRSVALASIGGFHLLATGGSDRAARLWHALGGESAGPPLPHPAPVNSLAFGEVEGRTMLVTGCADGNTRLWDPLRASAARVEVEGWFPSVAMDAALVAAGTEGGHVRLWDVASGNSYPPLPVDSGPGPVPSAGVRVWLGGTSPRLLLALHGGWIDIWDVSDPSKPAFVRHAEIGYPTRSAVHAARGLPLLATPGDAGEVIVFDLLTNTELFRWRIDGADSVRFIDGPEHPLLGVWVHSELRLLDSESPKRAYPSLLVSSTSHLALGRLDGADVLAALDNEGLRLFDVRTGEPTIDPIKRSSTASGIAWGKLGGREVVVTAHFATVRVWNPRTGRKLTELRFGTQIGAMSVRQIDGGRFLVAVSGPGLVLTELREVSS